jgi:hypothetical protein
MEVRMSLKTLTLITAMTLAAAEVPRAGVLATGTFQSKEAGLIAGGSFEIREEGGTLSLAVQPDFKVSEGPDLYFAFHPLAASAVTGGNAKSGAVRVDPGLRSLSGAQTYALPSGLDLAQFKSVVIHCWKFNHLYAAAVLKPSAATAIRPLPSRGKDGNRNVTLGTARGTAVDAAGRAIRPGEGRKAP